MWDSPHFFIVQIRYLSELGSRGNFLSPTSLKNGPYTSIMEGYVYAHMYTPSHPVFRWKSKNEISMINAMNAAFGKASTRRSVHSVANIL